MMLINVNHLENTFSLGLQNIMSFFHSSFSISCYALTDSYLSRSNARKAQANYLTLPVMSAERRIDEYMIVYFTAIPLVKAFLRRQILDSSRLKELADDNFKVVKNG